MARQILYRAADRPKVGYGAHFTPDEETARAYLVPGIGHGGKILFRYEVEVDEDLVADVRGSRGFEELAELASYSDPYEKASEWGGDGLRWVFQVLDERPEVEKRLQGKGYLWVIYEDDYPEGAETWRFLGETSPPKAVKIVGRRNNPARDLVRGLRF